MTEHPRAVSCPTCSRRLKPMASEKTEQMCHYLCVHCGATGFVRLNGTAVWSPGGDGSLESRQARASFKQDGFKQMRAAHAQPLPGIKS